MLVGVRRFVPLAPLGPLAQVRAGRLGRRLAQLALGLVLFGVSTALLVLGALGAMPWDVLHQGIALHVPLTFGQAVIATSALVLLAWIPLRQAPGLGTVANAVVVGLAADATLAVMARPSDLAVRVAFVVGGIVLNGVASGLYIGAQLGPGPRDGLMTGLARRTGWSLRAVRTGLEVLAVLLGWALGGVLGVATIAYALAVGPLVQFCLPWFTVALPEPTGEPAAS